MILAAGLGTRLRPLTDNTPKALVEIGGYTMLELAVKYLKKHGIDDIIVNVHHLANKIVRYIKANNYFDIKISFSDERCQLLDTGGAIKKASDFLKNEEPFLLMAVDVLTNLDIKIMLEFHKSRNSLVTLAVKKRDTSRSLLFDANMKLVGWKDNKTKEVKGTYAETALSALGFSGIHIIEPEIFRQIEEEGAFSVIDLYLRLMEIEPIHGFRHDNDIWLEFGRLERIETVAKSEEFKKLTNNL